MANIGTKGAYVRRETRARSTGGVVQIVDREHDETESAPDQFDPNRWALVCEHGYWITVGDLRSASQQASAPETWCDECELAAERRGYVIEAVTPLA